ncbi:MAG: O-methyltransferase [Actinomycetota bacterium]
MELLEEKVAAYMRGLCDRYDNDVLAAMEKIAEENGFPIVGRTVGACLQMFTRSIDAKDVFEMGSGYGYSAYWFSTAVGEKGHVTLTDGDPENAKKAEEHLTRAGLWSRCSFEVGDAIEALEKTDGEFDVVYNDIDKGDYPRAFEVARGKVRVGGYYMCDNVLWSGRVASDDDDAWTQAIRKHNQVIYSDENFVSSIIPIRDGVMVALRVS